MIELNHLVKKFGDLTAVDHVSLAVRTGEICGFLGPKGSGKTTFIRILCGLLRADDGSATYVDLVVRSASTAGRRA